MVSNSTIWTSHWHQLDNLLVFHAYFYFIWSKLFQWDISDFIRREITNNEETSAAVEHVWLVIYHALGRLCVDPRPPVRKSACDTLLQTVASHGLLVVACVLKIFLKEMKINIFVWFFEFTQVRRFENNRNWYLAEAQEVFIALKNLSIIIIILGQALSVHCWGKMLNEVCRIF